LKTARAWGATPTQFFKDWSGRDRTLAQAIQFLENQTNPETGLPSWIDGDPLRDFGVEERISFGSKVLAAKRKRFADSGTPTDGISFVVYDKGVPDFVQSGDE